MWKIACLGNRTKAICRESNPSEWPYLFCSPNISFQFYGNRWKFIGFVVRFHCVCRINQTTDFFFLICEDISWLFHGIKILVVLYGYYSYSHGSLFSFRLFIVKAPLWAAGTSPYNTAHSALRGDRIRKRGGWRQESAGLVFVWRRPCRKISSTSVQGRQ